MLCEIGDSKLRNADIALHEDRRQSVLAAIVFLLLLMLVSVVIYCQLQTLFMHLDTLLLSRYEYSMTMKEAAGENDYYHFDAGITFLINDDSETSINADVIMQCAESTYSDLVLWNTSKMDANEIAISRNLAKQYGLAEGDYLFSNHIVNGEITRYRIKDIIPASTSVRTLKTSTAEGVIIMGYDSRYVDNISFTCIVFSKIPVEENESISFGNVSDILYRTDEIQYIALKIMPYILFSICICSVMIVCFVKYMTKKIACNYKRLSILGCGKELLNNLFVRYILLYSLLALTISAGLLIIIIVVGRGWISLGYGCLLILIWFITLMSTIRYEKNALWGK